MIYDHAYRSGIRLCKRMTIPILLGAMLSCYVPESADLANVCTVDSTICPSENVTCTVSTILTVDEGCTLDFGTRKVTFTSTGGLSFPGRSVALKAGALVMDTGSTFTGRNTTGPGGNLRLSVSGSGCGTYCAELHGQLDVSSTVSNAGFITLDSKGHVLADGPSWSATSQLSGSYAGFIQVRADKNLTVNTPLYVSSVRGARGGSVSLEAYELIRIKKLIDVSNGAYHGGEIIVRADGRIEVDAVTLSANGGTLGGQGGVITLESMGESATSDDGATTLNSLISSSATISANANGPSGFSGNGGAVNVRSQTTYSHTTGSIQAQGIGTTGRGGDITLSGRTGLTTTVAITASSRAGGDGLGGGRGGTVMLMAPYGALSVTGALTSTASAAGGTGGNVYANASGNITFTSSNSSIINVAATGSSGVGGNVKFHSGGTTTLATPIKADGGTAGGVIGFWSKNAATVNASRILTANGTGNGAGGKVLVESNTGAFNVNGGIEAKGAGSGGGGWIVVRGASVTIPSGGSTKTTGSNGATYLVSPGLITVAGSMTAGTQNRLTYAQSMPVVTGTVTPTATLVQSSGLKLFSTPPPVLLTGSDNKAGRTYDYNCPTDIVAPLSATQLVGAVALNSSSALSAQGVTISNGAMQSDGSILVSGPEVTIRFPHAVRGIGLNAWNGTGTISQGSEANRAAPLILEIIGTPLLANPRTPPEFRFWTYQGLNWDGQAACNAGASNCSPLYNNIGIPASGTESQPAYLGMFGADTVQFSEFSITALNYAEALAASGTPGIPTWTLKNLTFTTRLGGSMCWQADANWRMVTSYEPDMNTNYTPWLRTESHPQHHGHSAGSYWEFNTYTSGMPVMGTELQGSGLAGNLISPVSQLRPLRPESTIWQTVEGTQMCDVPGQKDFMGLLHFSHFHFQGYHETEDDWPSDPGTPSAGNSFFYDKDMLCSGTPPTNSDDAELYAAYEAIFGNIQDLCAFFDCCYNIEGNVTIDGQNQVKKLRIAELDTTTGTVSLLPVTSGFGANDVVVNALLHPVCGAMCIQAMQWERDACVPRPPEDDRRYIEYSLNNGRSWRRYNWSDNRYHNGYAAEWHYNHGHAAQDGDGMLGMDDDMGFDWDLDGVLEMSSWETIPDNNEYDKQFGYLLNASEPAVQHQYAFPAMRIRMRFEEDGNGTCIDASGDNYCAGWRVDDVSISYAEEAITPRTKFYDGMGDYDRQMALFIDPTWAFLGTSFESGISDDMAEATESCQNPSQFNAATMQCQDLNMQVMANIDAAMMGMPRQQARRSTAVARSSRLGTGSRSSTIPAALRYLVPEGEVISSPELEPINTASAER